MDRPIYYPTDPWVQFQWARYLDKHQDTRASIEDHNSPLFPRLAFELFSHLYGDPEPVSVTRPEDAWARKAFEALDTPETDRLRREVRGNRVKAGDAATQLATQFATTLGQAIPNEDAQAIRDRLKGLLDFTKISPENPNPELIKEIEYLKALGQATVKAAVASAATVDESSLRLALRAASEQAREQIEHTEECANAFSAWGTGTEVQNMPSSPEDQEAKAKLAQAIKNVSKLRRIAELAGRLKRIAAQKQAEKVDYIRSEVVDIETGHAIDRLLPVELGKLADDDRFADFARGYLEHSLLQYRQSGKDTLGHGPLVICLDQSSSMSSPAGNPEVWAKAFLLALIQVAAIQQRDVHVVHFNSGVITTETWDPKNIDPEKLMQSLASLYGGGTAFEAPLEHALRHIETSGKFQKADIVLITDGDAPLNETWIADFNNRRKVRKVGVYSIQIGNGSYGPLSLVSDQVIALSDVLQDGKALEILGL